MSGKSSWGVAAGITPPVQVVYQKVNLEKELEQVATGDAATKLLLQNLGQELIRDEGLMETEDDNSWQGESMILALDDVLDD